MATIHPSRMNLIPQDMRSTHIERPRGRSNSPSRSRRSPSPPTRRDRSRDDRDRDRDGDRDRVGGSNGRGRRERSGSEDSLRGGHRRSQNRRSSPQYDEYRRALPPPSESSAPWRQPENMYSSKRDQPHHGRPTYGSAGADFLESRRAQREARTVNIWPPSPKAPTRELSPKRKKSSRKSKRQRSPSVTETSSDEEERRRQERKEKKRARKAKEEDERRERRRQHRSRRNSVDESENEIRQHKRQSKDRSRSKSVREASPSPSRSPDRVDQDDRGTAMSPSNSQPQPSSGPPLSDNQDSDEDIGPQPMQKIGGKKVDERSYGGALLRGEGSAMAAFLQDGIEARIPRRGEIGLSSEQIAQYEDVGYVMSGSRHRRMNAVRMRKENQVISAEEKRGILKLQRDERERREAILREEFSELVNERLKGSGSEPRAK